MISTSLVLAAALLAAQSHEPGSPSVAFFYGRPLPVAELAQYRWVVVEPENAGARELQQLLDAGVEVFAYLSLGEASASAVDPAWVLGRNEAWNNVVLDPASPGWRARVLARVDELAKRGYRGLFLDTLDSYQLAISGREAQVAAASALAALIRAIHERRPAMKLFFNRGFDLFPEVGELAGGIAAESLFHGWDPASKRYVEVKASDRDWLAAKLQTIRNELNIPVVIVDYLPATRREDARAAARKIEAYGFVPWISEPALDVFGVGAASGARVAHLLYDGAEPSPVLLRVIAERLEKMGYRVEQIDVRRGLPAAVRGPIVTWFTDDELPASIGYPRWLTRQIDAGRRVAIFGRPGFPMSRPMLAKLGLAPVGDAETRVLRFVKRDAMVIGTDLEPLPKSRGMIRFSAALDRVHVHLRIEDERGQAIDPVVTAPWGGVALQPYLYETGVEGSTRWIVDPGLFLEKALSVGD